MFRRDRQAKTELTGLDKTPKVIPTKKKKKLREKKEKNLKYSWPRLFLVYTFLTESSYGCLFLHVLFLTVPA